MNVEYDPARDRLDPRRRAPGTTAAPTETVAPGVHADFDRDASTKAFGTLPSAKAFGILLHFVQGGSLIGLEILDASDVLGDNVQFEMVSPPIPTTVGVELDVPTRPASVS